MAYASAADCAREAAALAAVGRDSDAEASFETALARFPGDARLANSAGNFFARARRDERALSLFERALELEPAFAEAAINAAIVLLRSGRPARAAALLAGVPLAVATSSRFWALRSDAAKALGDYTAADALLREAEIRDRADKQVLSRRARLSLERGEARAVSDHEAALTAEPGNFEVMEGYMQALQAEGRGGEALDFGHALAAHFPTWIAGQAALSELRWAAGDRDYAAHFATAAAAQPVPELYLEWAAMLSGNDDHDQAAEVLARAAAQWPEDDRIALRRAMALEEAGDVRAAEAALPKPVDRPADEVELVQARIDLRLGRTERAEASLRSLTARDRRNVAAWALLDLAWRLIGDPRHGWLHGQDGLVRQLELPLSVGRLEAVRDLLRERHRRASIPLAQSVKGGTQTRGALFADAAPELAELKTAIGEVLEAYRRDLPAMDPSHPLLADRDRDWIIAGSWSVRFAGEGRHAAHIHPRGLLSSACYLVVPPEVDAPGGPGWLELGRPPVGLAPELGPLHEIRPRPGMCALFPSTLFHGTRPLEAGERMTVAFDVAAAAD